MTLDEARGLAGQVVSYRPVGLDPEYGVIWRTVDTAVIVRFIGDEFARPCAPQMLTLELGMPLVCDRCHMPVHFDLSTGEFKHADVADAAFCGIVFRRYEPGADDVRGI